MGKADEANDLADFFAGKPQPVAQKKPEAKPAPRPSVKPAAKPVAKPAAKPAPRAPAKPVPVQRAHVPSFSEFQKFCEKHQDEEPMKSMHKRFIDKKKPLDAVVMRVLEVLREMK